MPKGNRRTESRSIPQTGQDLGIEVARDLMTLPKDERQKAVRFINAMNEAVNRETEALAAK